MENYVSFALNDYITITSSFDLWMSQASFDTFILVVNSKWLLYYVVQLGCLRPQILQELEWQHKCRGFCLLNYNLLDKVIAYVKDEGSDLNTLLKALFYVFTCDPLAFQAPWHDTCCGNAFNLAYYYACNNTKSLCWHLRGQYQT